MVIKCLIIIPDIRRFCKGKLPGIYESSGKKQAPYRKMAQFVGKIEKSAPPPKGGGALSDGQRPRYNLHNSQVGRLQLTLLLPTSSRAMQPGGLQTIC